MDQLTFLAVHAHPDDEASSSGGLYRLLADQGVRTVLVTCTNGECGDAADGAKPDADHHDGDEVAKIRAVELDHAVKILGIITTPLLEVHKIAIAAAEKILPLIDKDSSTAENKDRAEFLSAYRATP